MKRLAHVIALGAALLVSRPAHAITLGLDLGGGYWFEGAAQFDLHFDLHQRLGRVVSIGVRPGILLNVSSVATVGLPIDLVLRFHVSRVYFDLLGGLTTVFGATQPFRAHGAGGMGVLFGGFSLGLEAGYLMYGPQLLVRLGFMF